MAAGASVEDALAAVRQETVFTTHTPIAAGNEGFVLADAIGRATLYDDIRPEWIKAGLDRVLR